MAIEDQSIPQGDTPIGVPNFGLAPDPNAPKPVTVPATPPVNYEEMIAKLKADSAKTQSGLHKTLEEQRRQLQITQDALQKYEREKFNTLPEVEQRSVEAKQWQERYQELEGKLKTIEQERMQQQVERVIQEKYGLTRAELEAVSPVFGENFDPSLVPFYAVEALHKKYSNQPPPVQKAAEVPQATSPERSAVGRVTTPANSSNDFQARYNAAMKNKNYDQVNDITEQAFQKGVVIDPNLWMSG